MIITRFEKVLIPQNFEGQKFADDYEIDLRKEGKFIGRAEDTQAIIITSQNWFEARKK